MCAGGLALGFRGVRAALARPELHIDVELLFQPVIADGRARMSRARGRSQEEHESICRWEDTASFLPTPAPLENVSCLSRLASLSTQEQKDGRKAYEQTTRRDTKRSVAHVPLRDLQLALEAGGDERRVAC